MNTCPICGAETEGSTVRAMPKVLIVLGTASSRLQGVY